jgi:DNA topoisomerase-1
MAKFLVIVESPAKAKTIGKYLGRDYIVEASVGHIKDLPSSQLGVDIENDFAPVYEVIKGKKKRIDEIKKSSEKVETVLLAPDPDREGEAIAWHIAEELRKKPKKGETNPGLMTKGGAPIKRVLFNEITKAAILEAIKHPIEIDKSKFEAQQARRILDRIVGYKISPLLWEKVRRGLSAGRVQSVAVRLVCEREALVRAFIKEEYWSVAVRLEGSKAPAFPAKIDKLSGKKLEIPDKAAADAILAALKAGIFSLNEIIKKEQRRFPTPPFITSKLQQEASRKLGFTAKKTMMLAQRLYEGIEIEGETVGLITYMRTDSVRVSDQAIIDVRQFIGSEFGQEFLPEKPIVYKTKKSAQDAHEAIRPTGMAYTPQRAKEFLERDQFRLYELIWQRFVASQMVPAVFDSTVFVIHNGAYELRASGSILKFSGFIRVYREDHDEGDTVDDAEEGKVLPNLSEGETLKPLEWLPEQHFTQPPPRFTEASLVKELEEKGIGRPSTYATIMSTIQDKKYVEKIEGKFHPTQLGGMVNTLLVEHFARIMDVAFTAKMEGELDEVEEGRRAWVSTLQDFYGPFQSDLVKATAAMPNIKRQEIATEFVCEKCQAPMVIKFGKNGEFLACSKYPECRSTKEFERQSDGSIKAVEANNQTDEKCEKCSLPMVIKKGRFGQFLACSGYPECKSTKAISLGINCPDCGKPVAERRTKRGKPFYGCTGYPNCKYASWDKPVNQACPECKSPFLVLKVTKTRGNQLKCPNKDCDFEKDLDTSSPADGAAVESA